MSESAMIAAVNAALANHGIDDRVHAVGQFTPRGATGAMFAGGLIGDQAGGLLGPGGNAVGTISGALAARQAAGRTQRLPQWVLVGVSTGWVYGFAGRSRSREPPPHHPQQRRDQRPTRPLIPWSQRPRVCDAAQQAARSR